MKQPNILHSVRTPRLAFFSSVCLGCCVFPPFPCQVHYLQQVPPFWSPHISCLCRNTAVFQLHRTERSKVTIRNKFSSNSSHNLPSKSGEPWWHVWSKFLPAARYHSTGGNSKNLISIYNGVKGRGETGFLCKNWDNAHRRAQGKWLCNSMRTPE